MLEVTSDVASVLDMLLDDVCSVGVTQFAAKMQPRKQVWSGLHKSVSSISGKLASLLVIGQKCLANCHSKSN